MQAALPRQHTFHEFVEQGNDEGGLAAAGAADHAVGDQGRAHRPEPGGRPAQILRDIARAAPAATDPGLGLQICLSADLAKRPRQERREFRSRPAGDGIDAAELEALDRLRQIRGAAAAKASSARSGAPSCACPPPSAFPARGPAFRRSRSRLVSGREPGDDAAMPSDIAAGPPGPGSPASRPGPFARLVKSLQIAASAPKSRTYELEEASLIV